MNIVIVNKTAGRAGATVKQLVEVLNVGISCAVHSLSSESIRINGTRIRELHSTFKNPFDGGLRFEEAHFVENFSRGRDHE